MNNAEKLEKLRTDFRYFAPNILKIRPKEIGAGLMPFALKPAQIALHEAAEEMWSETGRVRLLVLKGRQMGISTYIGGRFYHRTSMTPAVKAFILTHISDSTNALFKMTSRYHQNNVMAPSTSRMSTKELVFDKLDSGYGVGTAGSRSIGRGETIQFFHGSEVAFWENAEEHVNGLLETIPSGEAGAGSEIFLESTANGPQGVFYKMCQRAMRGEGDFRLVFLSWWTDPGYVATPPHGWEPPDEFRRYMETNDLTLGQIYWAYLKNYDKANALGTDPDSITWMFRQEYPQTAAEAFQTSGDAAFITPEYVLAARKPKKPIIPSGRTPIILGIDPAQGARDRTAIIDRQGRRAGRHIDETWDDKDAMSIARRIVLAIRRTRAAAVCIDHGGGGKEIGDRLEQLGYGSIVHIVNFGSRALEYQKYQNRRAEMYDNMRHWFWHDSGVQINDSDDLQSELCSAQWGPGATREDASGRLILEPKDKIRDRLEGLSPDRADALALTFAIDMIDEDPEIMYDTDYEDFNTYGAGDMNGRDEYTGY